MDYKKITNEEAKVSNHTKSLKMLSSKTKNNIPMKKLTLSLLIGSLLPMLFISQQASATHIAGGQITYAYAGSSGLRYDITYTHEITLALKFNQSHKASIAPKTGTKK